MSFDVLWADKKTKKSFDELLPSIQKRAAKMIKSLKSNPRPTGVKKLSGKLKGVWRIRIGDYRLLYDIDDASKKVVLLNLDHRRQIYR